MLQFYPSVQSNQFFSFLLFLIKLLKNNQPGSQPYFKNPKTIDSQRFVLIFNIDYSMYVLAPTKSYILANEKVSTAYQAHFPLSFTLSDNLFSSWSLFPVSGVFNLENKCLKDCIAFFKFFFFFFFFLLKK
jgi:hypothetical protein